jgi:hypothetical protein
LNYELASSSINPNAEPSIITSNITTNHHLPLSGWLDHLQSALAFMVEAPAYAVENNL